MAAAAAATATGVGAKRSLSSGSNDSTGPAAKRQRGDDKEEEDEEEHDGGESAFDDKSLLHVERQPVYYVSAFLSVRGDAYGPGDFMGSPHTAKFVSAVLWHAVSRITVTSSNGSRVPLLTIAVPHPSTPTHDHGIVLSSLRPIAPLPNPLTLTAKDMLSCDPPSDCKLHACDGPKHMEDGTLRCCGGNEVWFDVDLHVSKTAGEHAAHTRRARMFSRTMPSFNDVADDGMTGFEYTTFEFADAELALALHSLLLPVPGVAAIVQSYLLMDVRRIRRAVETSGFDVQSNGNGVCLYELPLFHSPTCRERPQRASLIVDPSCLEGQHSDDPSECG